MKKRNIIVCLFALLLAATSCGTDSQQSQNSDTTMSTEGATEDTVETIETRIQHAVPKMDFEGDTFNVGYTNWVEESLFFTESLTGDVLNDAIYNRKIMVEGHLNVSITQTDLGDLSTSVQTFKNTVMADDDSYQQIMLHCIMGVADLVASASLYPIEELPYVDLDADWWNKEKMEMLQLGKHTYYAVSDYLIPSLSAIYFNKEMIVNQNLDDPYQLVYDGQWTLDRFFDLAKAVKNDINGDNVYDDEDIVGIKGGNYHFNGFLPGCDQYITKKDNDGRVQLALNTEKTLDILGKLADAANEHGVIVCTDGQDERLSKNFESGNILFTLAETRSFTLFRDYEFGIGILPYPKYDEMQENYQSLDWGGLTGISAAIKNPDMVGSVMELMAWDSKNEVIPTYYDVLLGAKLAQDEQTRDMLDIIFDGVTYEVGGNYFGLDGAMNQLFYVGFYLPIANKSADFASYYASHEEAAQRQIDSFYNALIYAET